MNAHECQAHPIVDGILDVIDFDGDEPVLPREAVAGLRGELAALQDPDELTEVYVGLVQLLALLDDNGYQAARSALLEVVVAFRAARACLRPSPDGLPVSDVMDRRRGPRDFSAFAGAPRQTPLAGGPSMTLLAVRAAVCS